MSALPTSLTGWFETIHSGVAQAGSFVVDKSKVVLEKANEDGLVDKVKVKWCTLKSKIFFLLPPLILFYVL